MADRRRGILEREKECYGDGDEIWCYVRPRVCAVMCECGVLCYIHAYIYVCVCREGERTKTLGRG